MDEREFTEQAERALAHIEAVLETVDQGLDFELGAGGVLQVDFDDGSQMVINRHGAAREIWVAARSGGFHYRWQGTEWVDTRGGESLMQALSRLVSLQLGCPIQF